MLTTFPLSSSQMALYLHQQLLPNDDSYHIPTILQFDRHVTAFDLTTVINELAAQHSMLRACITLETPVNQITDYQFSVQELSVNDTDIKVTMQNLLQQPFVLHEAPLIRFYLFQPDHGGSILYIVHHHIILDYFPNSFLEALQAHYAKLS